MKTCTICFKEDRSVAYRPKMQQLACINCVEAWNKHNREFRNYVPAGVG